MCRGSEIQHQDCTLVSIICLLGVVCRGSEIQHQDCTHVSIICLLGVVCRGSEIQRQVDEIINSMIMSFKV